MIRISTLVLVAVAAAGLVACDGAELDTRTYELKYLPFPEARQLIAPYVYDDREGAPGSFEVTGSALTVRETADNLAKIERMLEEFDRPRPTVMLHFQIIRANGSTDVDPSIADVEQELRRLFRFDGYELVAETRVSGIQQTAIRQLARGGGEQFLITSGVSEVRARGDTPTVTLEVQLSTEEVGQILSTQVTIPAGHAVVLGSAQTEDAAALILVVRAEIAGTDMPGSDSTPATEATPG